MKLYVRVKTEEQLKAAAEYADCIIAGESAAEREGIFLTLPEILREKSAARIRGLLENESRFQGVEVNCPDELGLLREIGYSGAVIAGELLYSYNRETVNFFKGLFPGMEFIAPAELTDSELSELEAAANVSFIYKVYGR